MARHADRDRPSLARARPPFVVAIVRSESAFPRCELRPREPESESSSFDRACCDRDVVATIARVVSHPARHIRVDHPIVHRTASPLLACAVVVRERAGSCCEGDSGAPAPGRVAAAFSAGRSGTQLKAFEAASTGFGAR